MPLFPPSRGHKLWWMPGTFLLALGVVMFPDRWVNEGSRWHNTLRLTSTILFDAGLIILPLSAILIGAPKRRVEASSSECPRCGYDMRATPRRCPECGLVIFPDDTKSNHKAEPEVLLYAPPIAKRGPICGHDLLSRRPHERRGAPANADWSPGWYSRCTSCADPCNPFLPARRR